MLSDGPPPFRRGGVPIVEAGQPVGQPSSGRATPFPARLGVFPLPSHTVHWHPMSSISVRIISHLSRTRALTQPIPTRYDCCCFHSLGGEEKVVRRPHRRGSGPAMRSRSPEEEGAGPGALPVAGRGQRGRSATRNKGEPAYPMSYIGAGEGLRPFEPRPGGTPPSPLHPAAPFSCSRELRAWLSPRLAPVNRSLGPGSRPNRP